MRLPDFLFGFIDRLSRRLLDWAKSAGRKLTKRRLARGKPRTLWGVTPILTLPLKARADATLGFSSQSLVYTTYVITAGFDINLRKLVGAAFRIDARLWQPLHRLILAWALMRYDVFHTFADRGLLLPPERFGIDPAELEAWRDAGTRVYVYAYGADVRTRNKTLALGKWNFCVDCPEPLKFCICDDAIGSRIMAQTAARATAMVALGDMLTYMPGARHIAYWPIDIVKIKRCADMPAGGPLRIAHAPNHAHFKGSHYLEAAIEKLKGEGHAIEYVKVQGVPNTQVLDLFASADVVADQFIGGAYGYTALEALALGKPVLTFVRSPDLALAVDECPFLNVTPERIEGCLRWLLANRPQLAAIGAQGRVYIERWHSIEAVGGRLAELYQDTADFPEATARLLREARERERIRRGNVVQAAGWQHQWQIITQKAVAS